MSSKALAILGSIKDKSVLQEILNGLASAAGQYAASQIKNKIMEKTMTYSHPPKNPTKARSERKDRTESPPVTIGSKIVTKAPRVYSNNPQHMRVANREMILGTVAGSTGFAIQATIALNPGLAASFPWLSTRAQGYQQYIIHKLEYEWVPIAPTSTQGVIILSPDYDASDPTPITEVQAVDNKDSVELSCWMKGKCKLSKEAMMSPGKRKFVRPCLVAGDPKTFDAGVLYLASNNETGTGTIGKLYCDYDIEFFEPQNDPSPYSTPQQTSFYQRGASNTFANGAATSFTFDAPTYDPLGFGLGNVYVPPAGCYDILFEGCFADSVAENNTIRIDFFKNNGVLPKAIYSASIWPSLNDQSYIAVRGIVPMNGTDTFQVEVTISGAAGALTSISNTCRMQISLA